jgi:hypothetical protein
MKQGAGSRSVRTSFLFGRVPPPANQRQHARADNNDHNNQWIDHHQRRPRYGPQQRDCGPAGHDRGDAEEAGGLPCGDEGRLTLFAGPGIGAVVIVDFHSVRNLAVWKGLTAERAYWRGRVFLICRNGAMLRKPNRSTAFTYHHAWRFLRTLPDVD